MDPIFADREEAGRALALLLRSGRELRDPVVLALPRGGVPVGAEVARALDAPLDVILVRKLRFPGQPELAIGAIASGGIRVMNPDVTRGMPLPGNFVEELAEREAAALECQERLFRGDRPPTHVRGRSVVLVDDGVATGSSMFAAIRALRTQTPAEILVAVPLAPPSTLSRLEEAADGVVCSAAPDPFGAISLWYRSFPQVTDHEVRQILDTAEGALQ